MHDKIKAILPKEMRKEECTCFLSAPCRNCESEGDYDIGQRDGFNQALREVHAKIPEIVALVEGEVRKIVDDYIKYTPEQIIEMNKDFPSTLQQEAYLKSLGMIEAQKEIMASLETLFSNKK